MNMRDAQQRALGFLQVQGTYIEPQVYRIKYADIQYPGLVPVDTSAPEWISTVTYTSADQVGAAAWFHGNAQDVNKVGVTREQFESTVSMAAVGYGYDLEELGKAMLIPGMNLSADKAMAARRASEEFIDRVALFGDVSKGMLGLVNQTAVTIGTVPADGAGSSTTWASKTADQVLRDFNVGLMGGFTGSYGAEIADTVLLPYAVLVDISTRRIDTTNQTTILEWIRRNNVYTLQTGQQLEIRGVWGLETAGAGGIGRSVFYRKSPEVVKMHIPMPFRFMPAWQTGPIRFDVPGIFRLGGVDVRRPISFRYRDGIA